MRFYVSPGCIYPERHVIEVKDKQEIHHIRDVMRLDKGLEVVVFDGRGKEYLGSIKNISRTSVVIKIIRQMETKKDVPCNIALYQALPKKGKLDFIIEKAVELGVSRIIPMVTERTIPVLKIKNTKIDRWERIAIAAAKQCGRTALPALKGPMGFEECLNDSKKSDLVIFAALDKDAEPLKEILSSARPEKISVFVGPEGDFTRRETAMAREQGYLVCSLGSLVLRVETAAIYILSCLNYEYNQNKG